MPSFFSRIFGKKEDKEKEKEKEKGKENVEAKPTETTDASGGESVIPASGDVPPDPSKDSGEANSINTEHVEQPQSQLAPAAVPVPAQVTVDPPSQAASPPPVRAVPFMRMPSNTGSSVSDSGRHPVMGSQGRGPPPPFMMHHHPGQHPPMFPGPPGVHPGFAGPVPGRGGMMMGPRGGMFPGPPMHHGGFPGKAPPNGFQGKYYIGPRPPFPGPPQPSQLPPSGVAAHGGPAPSTGPSQPTPPQAVALPSTAETSSVQVAIPAPAEAPTMETAPTLGANTPAQGLASVNSVVPSLPPDQMPPVISAAPPAAQDQGNPSKPHFGSDGDETEEEITFVEAEEEVQAAANESERHQSNSALPTIQQPDPQPQPQSSAEPQAKPLTAETVATPRSVSEAPRAEPGASPATEQKMSRRDEVTAGAKSDDNDKSASVSQSSEKREHRTKKSSRRSKGPLLPTPLPTSPNNQGVGDAVSKKAFLKRFAQLLCQHQFFGKVERLRGLKLFSDDTSQQNESLLLAALKLPNRAETSIDQTRLDISDLLCLPQIQLNAEGAFRNADGTMTSTFLVFQARPGRMLFGSTNRELGRLWEAGADSCYVLDEFALRFRDPKHLDLLAEIQVVWRTTSDIPEMVCEHHKIPLQLYSPESRELCCALCYAKSPFHQDLVVLEDIFAPKGPNGKSLVSQLEEKDEYFQEFTRQMSHSHSQVASAANSKRAAVNMQFDLLVAAVEARRRQVVDEISNEESYVQSDLTKHLLAAQDARSQIRAAISLLRNAGSAPSPTALTTIAGAKELHVPSPVAAVKDPFQGLGVSVEPVIARVHDLGLLRSNPVERTELSKSSRALPKPESPPRARKGVGFESPTRLRRSSVQLATLHSSHLVDGTCVFNSALQELIEQSSKRPHTVVEWKLRIEDHGEWVGVGVAVGPDLRSVASGGFVDTRHLWVAPPHFPKTLKLRVTVGPHHNAKLTIHDANGAQLDDNRIAHWNNQRAAYPQVSFGDAQGKVSMLEQPHLISVRSTASR